MKTTVNEEEQKIIERTPFYSSIEYVYMDKRQKKEERYQTHKGYSKTKKRQDSARDSKRKRNQTRIFKERILYSK